MNTPDAVVVLCTAPDEASAQDLAAKVLAEKLAACVTLLPGATSLYYWEGKLELAAYITERAQGLARARTQPFYQS